jgi:signal transduction histidine kinase
MVIDDQHPRLHPTLIGSDPSADKREMRRDDRDAYQAWLVGELLLVGLLGASLALFLAYPELRSSYELPSLRLALDTGMMLAATIVAVLAGIRFSVERRRPDLLLCAGFAAAAGATLFFSVIPVLGGDPVGTAEAWAGVGGRLFGLWLIAVASVARGRIPEGRWALRVALVVVGVGLGGIWLLARSSGDTLPSLEPGADQSIPMIVALALQGFLSLVAVSGFGLRYRRYGEDLDRWFALAATLMLSAELHYIFTPVVSSGVVSQGDFLRLLAYGLLLAGVWRAIRFAEFGRAVAEERARVAREIHDGLAQYLFTISTHAAMLERGSAPEGTVSRLKAAAVLAQQEARFAILALSSASGNAPFDTALRRYLDVLTADGELAVELDVDPGIVLAPDEQIEVFRIVQEGLANVRKHAGATQAEVWIGRDGTKRLVRIRDDGAGFEPSENGAGQGLKNMKTRAVSIGGVFGFISAPGRGTAVEVVLRA